MTEKIIGWWSGGITSAVACRIAVDLYGPENVRIILLTQKMKTMTHTGL